MEDADRVPTRTRTPGMAVALYEPPAYLLPQTFDEVTTLAEKLSNADLVPATYRDRQGTISIAKVEIAIMYAQSLGLNPITALPLMAVINGVPSLWGDGLLAVVEGSGLLEDFEESFARSGTGDALSDDSLTAVCIVKRRGRPTPIKETFSVSMAKKAGVWTKSGPWTQYPSRMLRMRARAWALRTAFADVLRGVPSAEERMDVFEEGGAEYAVPQRPSRAEFDTAGATDVETAPAVTFEVIDHDGQVHRFEGIEHVNPALAFMLGQLHEAQKRGPAAVEGIWETNGAFLSMLREQGAGKDADSLGDTYASVLHAAEESEKKRAEAKAAKPAAPAAPRPPRSQPKPAPAREPEPALDLAPDEEEAPGAEGRVQWQERESDFFRRRPPSPTTAPDDKTAATVSLTWITWFGEQISRTPAEEVDSMLETFAPEFQVLDRINKPLADKTRGEIEKRRAAK